MGVSRCSQADPTLQSAVHKLEATAAQATALSEARQSLSEDGARRQLAQVEEAVDAALSKTQSVTEKVEAAGARDSSRYDVEAAIARVRALVCGVDLFCTGECVNCDNVWGGLHVHVQTRNARSQVAAAEEEVDDATASLAAVGAAGARSRIQGASRAAARAVSGLAAAKAAVEKLTELNEARLRRWLELLLCLWALCLCGVLFMVPSCCAFSIAERVVSSTLANISKLKAQRASLQGQKETVAARGAKYVLCLRCCCSVEEGGNSFSHTPCLSHCVQEATRP